jgi:hypothetical protein
MIVYFQVATLLKLQHLKLQPGRTLEVIVNYRRRNTKADSVLSVAGGARAPVGARTRGDVA